jgi:hypothetical protein
MTLTRRFILPALAVFLCAGTGSAQTPAGLLERGIFLEETAGDLDGAIRVYRQVLAASGLPRDVGLQAETRLAEIFQRRSHARQSTTPGVVSPVAPPQTTGQGCCGMFSGNYDETRPMTIVGKIIQIQWVNPLSIVVVEGTDGNTWALTIASPNAMIRGGLNKNTFKLGEEVVVEGYLPKGTGDNCPSAFPSACETIIAPGTTRESKHASARSITSLDGRNLFDRPAMEKASAAAGQQP